MIFMFSACSLKKVKTDLFEVAKLDFHENTIQRIFVVIEPNDVNDTLKIRQIICQLTDYYNLDKNSDISFFSDKKYANYKTELFMDDQHLLPPSEYKNWLSNYYLGEFEFASRQYKIFPECNIEHKQKTFILNRCS